MARSFHLSSTQRATWVGQLPELERGKQTGIAKALALRREGELASFKTTLSEFFKGKEKGLRSIFEHPARLDIVARELSVSADQMNRWLDIALGAPTEDDDDTYRVPGFEDYGAVPVEAVYFPPSVRSLNAHMPKHGVSHSAGGRLDLAKLVELAQAVAQPPTAKAIVLVGERGGGRTPTLQAIIGRLRHDNREVVRWDPRALAVPEACALLVDDLDGLDAVSRQRALDAVVSANATLLCAVHPGSAMDDLPVERVVVSLAGGDEAWATAYLAHLAGPVAQALSRRIDTSRLQQWLSDEPDATAFVHRADILGILARHVADGGAVPVAPDRLLTLVIARWSGVLRRKGHGAVARTLELCLREAMTQLAWTACQDGRWSHTPQQVAAAMVAAAGNNLAGDADGPWAQLGAPGMMSVVELLVECGFFVEHSAGLEPAQHVLQGAALGFRIGTAPAPVALLSRAVLDARWHEGVLVAARRQDDVAPILRDIASLPLGARVHAYPLVTRVLALDVRCSDPALLQRWFTRCLAWWAATPPDSRAMTFTLGAADASAPAPEKEALIGGSSPLLVLARASRSRASSLRAFNDHTLKDALPDDERAYLALLGREATPQRLVDAMLIGAPFQSEPILDPTCWNRFPSEQVRGQDLPGGLTREEYTTWWRVAGAPRLLRAPKGRAYVAGTAPGWDLTWSMCQLSKAGTRLWTDALLAEVNDGADGAPRAFAAAVTYLLTGGGTVNATGLHVTWEKISLRHRRALRDAAAQALPEPDRWFIDAEVITLVLQAWLAPEARDACWERWTEQSGPTLYRIPWRAFLDAGLPPRTLAQWAIATLPEEHRAVRLPPVANPQTSRLRAFTLHDPQDAPQAAALDHLIGSEDPDVIEALWVAPAEWAQPAVQKLKRLAPARHRRLVLEIAAKLPNTPSRFKVLAALPPEAGETDLWRALADSAPTRHEQVVRLAQTSAASTGDQRWGAARVALALLETLATPERAEAEAAMLDIVSALGESEASTWLVELHGKLDGPLSDIGWVLAQASNADEALNELVREVLAGPLRAHINRHGGWWGLAWRAGGLAYVRELLTLGQSDTPEDASTLARLHGCVEAGLFDVVVHALLSDPRLGRTSARVFAEWIAPQRLDLLAEALATQPLANEGGAPDPGTLALARKLLHIDAAQAVTWAEAALPSAPPPLRRAWWESLIRPLPPGEARLRAVTAWSAVRDAPAGWP